MYKTFKCYLFVGSIFVCDSKFKEVCSFIEFNFDFETRGESNIMKELKKFLV
jgi:hypothetical protein